MLIIYNHRCNVTLIQHKIDVQIENHDLFIQPDSVCLGSRLQYDRKKGKDFTVYDTFQNMSVEKSIRALCKSDKYVNQLTSVLPSEPGVYATFQDGSYYKANGALHHTEDAIVLCLEIFYDSLGTTNPLTSKSRMQNVGVFY